MVANVVDPKTLLDRARREVLGTLSYSVGTPLWANRRWKYFGKDTKNQVFGVLGADGFRGSGRRGYHSIELAEEYFEHYLTQLEHLPERIRAGITRGTISVPWWKIGICPIVAGGLGPEEIGERHSIELVEFYLEHCLTRLEHHHGRIRAEITRIWC
jgi:hypothetical protein